MMLRDFEGGMGAWVAVALLALACSATSTETSSSGGSSSGSVGNSSPGGRCTGDDAEAYHMRDLDSR